MNVVDIQRPIWEFEGLVNSILAQHVFSLLSKAQCLQLYLFQVVNLLHLLNLLHLVSPFQPFNLLIMARPLILNIHRHQPKEHLVCFLLHSCMVCLHIIFKTQSHRLHKQVITTNFLHWTVLTLHIQFLPGALHSRLSTNCLLISSKLLRPCRTMVITYFLIPVCSSTWLLQGNILSCGSEFAMLGSCMWQKSHLLLCQISIGAHFCQLTMLYWRRGKPSQCIIVKKSWI